MGQIMTYERLKQIHKNNRELERLSNKFVVCTEDYGLSSKGINDMPTSGEAVNTAISHREESYDIEREYRKLYYENELLIRRARQYIDLFPDWQLRMILTLYFINDMPLYDVAAAVGLTEKECEQIIGIHFSNLF